MKRILTIVVLFLTITSAITSQDTEKLVITILDFSTEEVSDAVLETIMDRLSSSLFQTAQYTIIDTEKRDALIEEMKFTLTGLSDESSVIEVGKLLAAQAIVMGSLSKVGSKYVVSAKMLETESGRTLHTADGTYRDLEQMIEDIPRIAGLLSGTVKGKLVYEKDTPEYKRRVLGISLIGSGAGVAAASGFFFINGGILLNRVNTSLDTYNTLDAGSLASEFDAAYSDYTTAFNDARDKRANLQMLSGAAGTAVGMITAGVGSYLLFSAKSAVEERGTASAAGFGYIHMASTSDGFQISVRFLR